MTDIVEIVVTVVAMAIARQSAIGDHAITLQQHHTHSYTQWKQKFCLAFNVSTMLSITRTQIHSTVQE